VKERTNTRLGFVAVALIFFLNGAISSAVSPRYAEISAALGVGPGAFGLALVGSTIGLGLAGTILAAGLSEKFGSRLSYGLPLVLFCATPALIAVAHSVRALFGVEFLQGFTNAPVDLAAGALALGLTAKPGKRLLTRFQFCFSCGSLVGAFAGAATAGRMGLAPYLFGIAGIAVVLATVAWRFLPTAGEEEEKVNKDDNRNSRTMWALAILAFFALFAEFIGQDWASVFYRSDLHAAPSQYGYGGFAFQFGFVVVLLIGERFAHRFGDAWVVAGGALLFAAAMATFVLSTSVVVATAALFVAGIGAGNGVPLTTSAVKGHPRFKLWMSRVTTVMYFGAGASRLVGLLTDLFSLRWALSLAIPVGIVVFAMAFKLLPGRKQGGSEVPAVG
jgi:MFS family permease